MCYLKRVVSMVKNQNIQKKTLMDQIVIGKDLPECKNCLYYENRGENDSAECRKVAHKSLINGNLFYNTVHNIRFNQTFCGTQGKYFVDKNEAINIIEERMKNTQSSDESEKY